MPITKIQSGITLNSARRTVNKFNGLKSRSGLPRNLKTAKLPLLKDEGLPKSITGAGTGAAVGAAVGAIIGSVIPVAGTAIGAQLGAVAGTGIGGVIGMLKEKDSD